MGQRHSAPRCESSHNNIRSVIEGHRNKVEEFLNLRLVPSASSYVPIRTLYKSYMSMRHDDVPSLEEFICCVKTAGCNDQLGTRGSSSELLILDVALRTPRDLIFM